MLKVDWKYCEVKMEIKIEPLKEINICSYCLGSGKLKAMQSSAVIGGGSIRGVDTKVKCEYCGGSGLAK